jgi:hypothetical protein
MKRPQGKVSRRTFLLAATAGTAAGAAAIVSRQDATQVARGGDTPGKKGYQLTEHVRNYYRTAKI